MIRNFSEPRTRAIVGGTGLVLLVGLTVCGVLIGWRYLPGFLGEWIGTLIGAMTSPFLLEASFAVIGLCIVVALNHWRWKRSGSEWVCLDQLDGRELPRDLPDHARWAVFPGDPPPGEEPTLQAQAEGAMAIGDHAQAAECLAAMPPADLQRPETLVLRRDLARATGRSRLAEELDRQLQTRPRD